MATAAWASTAWSCVAVKSKLATRCGSPKQEGHKKRRGTIDSGLSPASSLEEICQLHRGQVKSGLALMLPRPPHIQNLKETDARQPQASTLAAVSPELLLVRRRRGFAGSASCAGCSAAASSLASAAVSALAVPLPFARGLSPNIFRRPASSSPDGAASLLLLVLRRTGVRRVRRAGFGASASLFPSEASAVSLLGAAFTSSAASVASASAAVSRGSSAASSAEASSSRWPLASL